MIPVEKMKGKRKNSAEVRDALVEWVHDALIKCGGRAKLIDVARHIWLDHEDDLRLAGDLFYTWQYDMRWAATKLREMGVMKQSFSRRASLWELAK